MRHITVFLAMAALAAVTPIAGDSPSVRSEEPSITLGVTRLTLGMGQEKVLDDLRKQFEVRQDTLGPAGAPIWSVLTRSGPPYGLMGIVQFVDGKLNTINRYWNPWDETSIEDVGRVIFGAVDNFLGGGQSQCVVAADVRVDAAETKNITLYCNEKSLTISFSRLKGHNSLDITEVLIVPRPRKTP